MGGGEEARQPWIKDYYYDQGGWEGYIWDGVDRSFFVFSDSLQSGGCLYAGAGEGLISTTHSTAEMAVVLPTQSFAGIVCVAD